MLYLSVGMLAILFPLPGARVRAYFAYHRDAYSSELNGAQMLGRFIKGSVRAGAPASVFAGARAAGPLATFEGADTWVATPYRDGVALLGDAAACADPTWGQGLSLTLRGARTLRDALLAHDDSDNAARTYAAEHARAYGALHAVEDWMSELFLTPGPEADARRARAMDALAQDPTRAPDTFQSGPDRAMGEAERRRFFGEA
jgi:2-polyprenyl-6-methoxyphenol hydroxylase-like FAD-dependent oxidoreductase